MIFGATRSFIVGLVLVLTTAYGSMAWGQPAPIIGSFVPMTAEEKQSAELAVLSDPRMRAIVGTEQLRVASGDVEADKAETESFLTGTSDAPPSRRVTLVALNMRTNKAARAVISLRENRVLSVEQISPLDVPLVSADAEQALALAKSSPALRRALGDSLDRYKILEPGSEERVPFAAQVLPLRSTKRNDPCSIDRCLALIFRTEDGYLSLLAQVDLTRSTVSLNQGGGRRR